MNRQEKESARNRKTKIQKRKKAREKQREGERPRQERGIMERWEK